MEDIDREWLKRVIVEALKEDVGQGDVTTSLVVDDTLWAEAEIIAKERGVLAGLELAQEVFYEVNPEITFSGLVKDGAEIEEGQIVASIEGRLSPILAAERVALNFLSLLSGIATTTRAFVEKAGRYGVKIFDTRKTTPLLRPLERYAVRMGGGQNHRRGLDSGILIKDNHLVATSIISAISQARLKRPEGMAVEVEVHNLDQVREAISVRPEIIMLDNMEGSELKEAVRLIRTEAPEILIEVSGGITIGNVEEVAKLGIDMISVGCLTHSPKALDLSLEVKRCFYP